MKRPIILTFVTFILVVNICFGNENLRISRDDESLWVSLKINVKNPKELYKRLSSGLSNRLILSIEIKERRGGTIAFKKEYVFEVIYDVWDEKYRLFTFDPTKKLRFETSNKEEIYTKFVEIEDLRICDVKALSADTLYNIKVKVIINPVSKEIIEKIKEYLADPESTSKGSPPRTIFGSFVNVFIPELNTENIYKYELKSVNINEIPTKK
ncbi:MAG: hypothetical protein N2746_10165 [Deltaproteobacteria bacterium]|nr:hypothetical protein [Deltaproteobacteria bacterium]